MATTQNLFNGNGSLTTFTYTFPTLKDADVKAEVDNVLTTAFTLLTSPTRVQFSSAPASGTNNVRIFRDTEVDTAKAVFAAGSSIKATDLNNNMDQVLFSAQEEQGATITTHRIADNAITTAKIKNGAVNHDKLTSDSVQTVKIVDGAVTNAKLASDAVDGSKLADNSIDSEHYVDGSIDNAHIANGAVNHDKLTSDSVIEAKIANGAVTSGKIGSDAVDGSKIQDNSIDSEHYVDGSIDNAHLANGSVNHDKLTSDSVIEAKIANNAVTTAKINTNAVTNNELATNAVATVNITDGAVNHNKLTTDSVIEAKIANNAVTGSKIAANSIDSDHYVDGSIDLAHLANGSVNHDKLTTDSVIEAKIANNAVTADKIADAAIITNSEQAASTPDDVTFFTTAAVEARYFNASTGETIKDGVTFPDNDTSIATTAAINDRIIDLVDDVGGFVPIANETSFPNANPDVNNGAGTIVSVSTLASDHTSNGSGVITISNGTVGNSTVTINGAANSTTYSAGYGFLVETTTTLNTYTFHRLVPKATEVTTVAGKATEIGRLGTADAVADMNLLGTTAIVEDMNLLGTTACVADMALLGTTACIADMATIADTSNLIANIGTVAGIQANVTTVAGVSANVTTVATNITSVNDFAARYRVASSPPSSSLDTGDLYFDTSANELKVYNGSGWQGGVTATGNFASITGNTFTGSNTYNDTVKAIFGTSGDGLEIYHDGSNSIITDTGTGSLEIQSNGTGVFVQKAASEYLAKFLTDGAVELYHDNAKKFETTSTGVNLTDQLTVQGNINAVQHIYFPDNKVAYFGTGNDLEVYHSGTYNRSYIKATGTNHDLTIAADEVAITNSAVSETLAKFIVDGANELYYDNSKKFETTSGGCTATGQLNFTAAADPNISLRDDGKIAFGVGDDLKIWHDGTHSVINNAHATGYTLLQVANGEAGIQIIPNGAVELFYDNSKKFETTSTGVLMNGAINLLDSGGSGAVHNISLGTGNDLKLYHDGSNSYVSHDGGGTLSVRTNGSDEDLYLEGGRDVYITQGLSDGGENAIICKDNGAVELYYDNSKKLDTYANGINISGGINQTGYLDIDSDTSKLRLGDSQELEIYHDGTNSHIENSTGYLHLKSDSFAIAAKSVGENMILATANGAVELHYDGSKKFETISTGVKAHGANLQLVNAAAAGDAQLYIEAGEVGSAYITLAADNGDDDADKFRIIADDNGQLKFQNKAGGGWETNLECFGNGAVKIYKDNALKAETVTGGFKVTGNISFDSNNSGLYLGGSGGSNQLNDYETGTWTPTIDGSSANYTYHADTGGSYTKVGKMVTCFGVIRLTARSGSGHMELTGLPFTAGDHSSGDSNYEGGVVTTHIDNSQSGTHGPLGHIASGTTKAALYHQISSGNGSAWNADEMDATLRWHFIVQYMTT